MISKPYQLLCILLTVLFLCSCGKTAARQEQSQVIMSLGSRITSLDPALAADTTSQAVVCAFYDTLLQYKYTRGAYQLEPSMLREMPKLSADLKTYTFTLRDDLYFSDGPHFKGKTKQARKITAGHVVYSLLRLADTRLRSPGFWVIRDHIRGLAQFREKTRNAAPGDDSPYKAKHPGFTILDPHTFQIHLNSPNPRFHYALALPYCAIVSPDAVKYYGNDFASHPCGSGPFLLEEWKPDYVISMIRNPEFRPETFANAKPEEQNKTLPLTDRITCYLVKQPVSSWLMFLQGELDYYALDADHFESVIRDDRTLAPALQQRGIRLQTAPELQTNYIGFNFADPVLGKNQYLRKAIALAFDKKMRVTHSAGRFTPAYGPVPPGVPGALQAPDTTHENPDIALAKEYMKKAGYPDGIDPKTNRPLELTFDQTGSDTFYRQTAELFANDLRNIGIKLKPEFNTRPRFFQKLANGDMQMFRLSWTGDYPDAENFLQLFYGPNAGSCNRISFTDPEFDRMYKEILSMQDTPERTKKYENMSRYLIEKTPWIFETHTVSFVLTHSWMENYIPHDFAFNRWKYLSADAKKRIETKRNFKPLSMKELR